MLWVWVAAAITWQVVFQFSVIAIDRKAQQDFSPAKLPLELSLVERWFSVRYRRLALLYRNHIRTYCNFPSVCRFGRRHPDGSARDGNVHPDGLTGGRGLNFGHIRKPNETSPPRWLMVVDPTPTICRRDDFGLRARRGAPIRLGSVQSKEEEHVHFRKWPNCVLLLRQRVGACVRKRVVKMQLRRTSVLGGAVGWMTSRRAQIGAEFNFRTDAVDAVGDWFYCLCLICDIGWRQFLSFSSDRCIDFF